jgi:hypothetical protein
LNKREAQFRKVEIKEDIRKPWIEEIPKEVNAAFLTGEWMANSRVRIECVEVSVSPRAEHSVKDIYN